jgi:hypothetical protein
MNSILYNLQYNMNEGADKLFEEKSKILQVLYEQKKSKRSTTSIDKDKIDYSVSKTLASISAVKKKSKKV